MPPVDPQKQRAFAIDVVRKLRARGFEAYWAGGCVRDQLLGRSAKDYDVATAAKPAEIREIFGHRRTVPVGAAFGVITVIGPRGAGQVEVATFRQDATYSDGRHPDAVSFSTPRADAERRDFTVNGLFYDPLEDRVIDYVGGQDDLARGVLRAIGQPRQRFSEDKLRLLRAVRFATAFDFTLDPATREAICAMAADVTVVSAERIAGEMQWMLVHPARAKAVSLLRDVGLLEAVLPELASANQPDAMTPKGRRADEAWITTLEVLQVLVDPSFPLALAALVHAFVDASATLELCRRWKLSNHQMQRTRWLLDHQAALVGARNIAWPKLQRLLISAGIEDLIGLHEAIAKAAGKSVDDAVYCRELLAMPPEELNPPPLVTGDDLVSHGVPRGKQYQRLLEAVRDAQLEARIKTKQDALALVDQLRKDGEHNEPKVD